MDVPDERTMERLLRRGVAEIIVQSEFVELLKMGRPLRLKMGFDPSAPDIHLGHAVGLRKLRQLQELGHTVVLIVGDWTARIGDPSGRSATRPMLTAEQVRENAETYLAQFFKIVDRDRAETRWQSEWFGDFTLTDVINLTSKFTVAQLLAREDFAKRFKANQPIAITELLYPLLQAYDSVAIESDVEFGGTDQRFNLLVGRDLQEMRGQKPQQCFLMPLLPGTDGVQKMSKSLGNYIGIDEPANDIYGKTMSLPDSMIIPYFDYLTDLPDGELSEMRSALEAGSVNPIEFKKRLAADLVTQFHDAPSAISAAEYFELTVQRSQVPEDIPVFVLPALDELKGKRLSRLLQDAGLVTSISEARRLILQGAVQINGHVVKSDDGADTLDLKANDVIRAGRRRYVRLVR
ncbi:MAG: tyrosine--tRNA ligase [Chloroflexi bacterium]|nr:tyrosine--tRNA ligase [Chloroflexota bacterium]